MMILHKIFNVLSKIVKFVVPIIVFGAIYAIPTIIVTDVRVLPDGTYYKEIPVNQQSVITIQVRNTENTDYKYWINYNSILPATIKRGTETLGSGSLFNTRKVVVTAGTTDILQLIYNSNIVGEYRVTLTFFYEKKVVSGNITRWEGAGSRAITLKIKVVRQQQPQPQQPQQPQPQQPKPSQCLYLLRSKIYKVMYINDTLDLSVGVINVCNKTITLLDADLEGIPEEIAYIKDADLGRLGPGKVTYIKIHVSTQKIRKPTTLTFDLIVIGAHDNVVETGKTSFVIKVIREDQLPVITPSEEEEEKTETIEYSNQLKVDYTIQSGYLIIKGAYVEKLKNGTVVGRKYIDASISVIFEGQTIAYTGPIKVEPGKTYCIYAYKPGYLPFFECKEIPKRPLCVELEPEGKKYGNAYYYELGTVLKIAKVYDCSTGDPVSNYKVFLGEKILDKPEINITFTNVRTLKIVAEGYNEYKINIRGYEPLYFKTGLPRYVGNYTIEIGGTFASTATLTIYKINPDNTKQIIYSKRGSKHDIEIANPGYYEFVVEGPLSSISKKVYIENITTTEHTEENKGGISILNILIWVAIVGGVILVVLIIAGIRSRRGPSLTEQLKEISKYTK